MGKMHLPMQAVIVDEKGSEIEGECSGYLCIKNSWPGAFRTLYGDHERYETTYFKPFLGYYFSGDGCSSWPEDKGQEHSFTARSLLTQHGGERAESASRISPMARGKMASAQPHQVLAGWASGECPVPSGEKDKERWPG
ncbi:hypothetical protein KSP40_PGU021823 [Platanthera guangdongensis]|uniref:Uncharacterized protein n=1 Tax=Platanthera guangdongensis TaxID=2320717 RepID=A0ABR2N250_9ASPA